jgi:hypothetical protein
MPLKAYPEPSNGYSDRRFEVNNETRVSNLLRNYGSDIILSSRMLESRLRGKGGSPGLFDKAVRAIFISKVYFLRSSLQQGR